MVNGLVPMDVRNMPYWQAKLMSKMMASFYDGLEASKRK
jgi:hypothetical protein